MPMRYADRADVLRDLNLDEADEADAPVIARVERLENGLAAAFDQKTGRSFGVAPVAETRTVTGYGSDVLVLTDGVRSVSGVTVNDTALAIDAYALGYVDRDGLAYGLRLASGAWYGPVLVTAVWGDQSGEEVPADVREALTFITVEQYRAQTSSPAGFAGPENLFVPTRNPWNFEMVKAAIERHRVVQVIV